MIVIGYQGIGKSTLAGRNCRYIDLESGCFWINGKRPDDWYLYYCSIAEHLSKQGYIVFVSSHEVVRTRLEWSCEDVAIVYPSIELKDYWISKLKKRYAETKLDKDYKAFMNAKERYAENIKELKDCNIPYKICFSETDYDLESMIIHLKNTKNLR